ncbi:MAG TPA: hypothetical protein VK619_00085 [Pyrinomonadaceae bacterium]|nr:hypothetical protein [Pyrinomonadaceae bacterium]
MSNIERAIFYEGQILSASDLTTAVESSRNQQARHERYLHLWGIARGLELTGKEKTDTGGKKYQEVTLSAGVAIDGRGREVVVPEDELLSEALFDELNLVINDGDALYPVFLIGRDQTASQQAIAARSCDSSQPTRKVEGFEITFGRPGEELDLDNQTEPTIAEGLEELSDDDPWRILLGFVKWGEKDTDPAKRIKRFTKVESESSEGVGPRYAGVQADEVAARAGTLTLRTRTQNQSGKPGLIVDETDNGQLRFGQLTSQGDVTPVFTVNSKGDLTITGKLSSAVTPGSIQMQSGIAMDGILLPLPVGITQDQVDAGKVLLNIHLTLHTPSTPPNTTDIWGAFPLECSVDSNRRVRCRIRWFKLAGGGATNISDLPALCDYVVVASVLATTGS